MSYDSRNKPQSRRSEIRLWGTPFHFPEIFEDFGRQVGLLPAVGNEQTGLELSEDNKNIYVQAALPGLNPENIEVTLEKGMLQIKGETKEEEEDKERKYYRNRQRSFWYQVAIPGQIDESQEPKANYNNGILELTLSKAKPTQSKKITINPTQNKKGA